MIPWKKAKTEAFSWLPAFENLFFQDGSLCPVCGESNAGISHLFWRGVNEAEGRRRILSIPISPFAGQLCSGCCEHIEWLPAKRALGAEEEFVCYTGAFYNNFLKELFARYKFEGASYLEEFFKRLMVLCVEQIRPLSQISWVTYVPSQRSRLLLRAYNPSRRMAEAIARARGIPLYDLFTQRGSHREQNKSSYEDRISNVKNRFCIKAVYREGKKPLPRGMGLLVDDFLTTGATMTSLLGLGTRSGLSLEGLCLAASSYPVVEECLLPQKNNPVPLNGRQEGYNKKREKTVEKERMCHENRIGGTPYHF